MSKYGETASKNIVAEFSEALINRGITPDKKLYEKVTPRGLYKLSPWAWKQAKLMDDARDMSYFELMNQCRMAVAKQELEAAMDSQRVRLESERLASTQASPRKDYRE